MAVQRTGGFIGRRAVPTASSASGMWHVSEVDAANRDGIWPSTRDALFSAVSVLLHMDGSNNSTNFVDSSLNSVAFTTNGNSRLSSAQSRFGGASGFFDGTGDYISTASTPLFQFGTGPYTVEAFVFITAYASSSMRILSTAGTVSQYSFEVDSVGRLFHWNGSSGTIFGASGTVPLNTWTHVAFCRSGTSLRAFANGTQVGSTATSTANHLPTNAINFPATANYSSSVGYIDEIRITKAARFTGTTLAVPEQPFPDAG